MVHAVVPDRPTSCRLCGPSRNCCCSQEQTDQDAAHGKALLISGPLVLLILCFCLAIESLYLGHIYSVLDIKNELIYINIYDYKNWSFRNNMNFIHDNFNIIISLCKKIKMDKSLLRIIALCNYAFCNLIELFPYNIVIVLTMPFVILENYLLMCLSLF